MASFNKVILMGNLTKDPKLSSTVSGSSLCEFSIAINRRYSIGGQEKEEVCFVDIIVWGKQADSCGKFLQKGSAVFIEGRLKMDTWDDKDGKKRSRLRVSADRVQFIGSRSDNSRANTAEGYSEDGAESYHEHQSAPARNNRSTQAMPTAPSEAFEEVEHEDDIPF